MTYRKPADWGGIRSGQFEIHALGRRRIATIDLTKFSAHLEGIGEVPPHLLAQLLDMVRSVAPVRVERDMELVDELREDNGRRIAEEGHLALSCAFDSVADPAGIPDGYDCGGCACHLSAPCRHCLDHLPDEDSEYIATMLSLTGRATA